MIQELTLKGLTDTQISRILKEKVPMQELIYANIKVVVFIKKDPYPARIMFDAKEKWNFDFEGTSDDFLRILSDPE